VRGLELCATTGEAGDVYNLASGVETTIRELAELVNHLAGSPTPIEFRPQREWDHAGKRFGSTAKARGALGFEARVALDDGLRRTIAWTRDNLDLIDRCIQKHAAFAELA
jgi:nucleoside-diphosphate-sugar epimerase